MFVDARQFVQLWTRAQPEVRRYVLMLVPRAADAEDVVQETATGLWEKFEQYDPAQPFVAWAIRFAHLEVPKWRQRQARARVSRPVFPPPEADPCGSTRSPSPPGPGSGAGSARCTADPRNARGPPRPSPAGSCV